MADDSYIGVSGQSTGESAISPGSQSESVRTGVVCLGVAIVIGLAISFLATGTGLAPLIGVVGGFLFGLVTLGVIALLGGYFSPKRIFNAAGALSLVGLVTSFVGIIGAFISFVAFIKALDYIGFSPFTSFFIALALNVAAAILLISFRV